MRNGLRTALLTLALMGLGLSITPRLKAPQVHRPQRGPTQLIRAISWKSRFGKKRTCSGRPSSGLTVSSRSR
jgi:hypothetical protein